MLLNLTRRTMLGGAGAMLALPWMSRRAHAARPPKRLVIFFTANGTVHDDWAPVGSETHFALSPILAPLEAHKQDLVILDGIDMESSYHGPGDASHWNGMGHMLTGTELIETMPDWFWGGGISVDQHIANAIGGDTYLPSLELGVEELYSHVATRMSYRAAADPIPPIFDPAEAFERLFADVPPRLRNRRRAVLKAVAEDFSALSRKLGREDRIRLDAHLERVNAIATRIDALPGGHCSATVPPAVDATDALSFPTVSQLQMDMLVQALACDITRVASLQWSIAGSNVAHEWLGISDSHHQLSHSTDVASLAKLTQINTWLAEQFAYLLSAMKAVDEDGGSLLDHSLVLWCNELGEGSDHTRRRVPFILAGSCGGELMTGRYLTYGQHGVQPHNDLLVSICQLMGLHVSSFGNPLYCKGPLPGLV